MSEELISNSQGRFVARLALYTLIGAKGWTREQFLEFVEGVKMIDAEFGGRR